MSIDTRMFLINLDRSPARLAFVSRQAAQQDLTIERIRAFEGAAEIPIWLGAQFDFASGISAGEIGCYASHLSVCARIRDQGLPAAIVLEDDVLLDPDFAVTCRRAIESAPAGWDVVHFSSVFKKHYYPIRQLHNGRSLVHYARLPCNSAAYAISAAGAAKLLRPGRRNRPYDLEFRYAWIRNLNVVGVYPPPARQREDIPSTIDSNHHGRVAGSGAKVGKSRVQKSWKPSIASQVSGRLYVMRRLRVAGMLQCWRRAFSLGLSDLRTKAVQSLDNGLVQTRFGRRYVNRVG